MKTCKCERKFTVNGKTCERCGGMVAVNPHRRFWIETPSGNDAHILGDPKMTSATKRALGEMIDAAIAAANSGLLPTPANVLRADAAALKKSKPELMNKIKSILKGKQANDGFIGSCKCHIGGTRCPMHSNRFA